MIMQVYKTFVVCVNGNYTPALLISIVWKTHLTTLCNSKMICSVVDMAVTLLLLHNILYKVQCTDHRYFLGLSLPFNYT